MIEPTVGRTDYQEEIATLNGVNIPLAAYRDLSGAVAGRHCASAPARAAGAIHSAIIMPCATGAADPAADADAGPAIADAYFRLNDPMPFLDTKLAALRKRLGFHKKQNGPTRVITFHTRTSSPAARLLGTSHPDAGPERVIAEGPALAGHARRTIPRRMTAASPAISASKGLVDLLSGNHRLYRRHHAGWRLRSRSRSESSRRAIAMLRLAGVHSISRRRLSGRHDRPDAARARHLQHRPDSDRAGRRRQGWTRASRRRW